MNRRISSDTPIDLQMRTTYSDRRWSAEQLLDYVAEEGFGLVAVTDHDRLDTVASMQHLGAQKQVSVLSAVEISAAFHGKMADILCFGFDPYDQALRAIADGVRQRQKDNAEQVYEELLRRGYQFPHRKEEKELPGSYYAIGRMICMLFVAAMSREARSCRNAEHAASHCVDD